MNDIYARRFSQTNMLQQLMRMHPTLYNATQLTKEPLNAQFVREEFMRINGHRQMHMLLLEATRHTHHISHWNALHNTGAWTESHRAYAVRAQTPMTQRFANVGRLSESLASIRTGTSPQSIWLEHMARTEGVMIPSEEQELEEDEDGDDAKGQAALPAGDEDGSE